MSLRKKLRFLPTKATFNLGAKLGAGTVGIVYRATSPDLDHPVAIKLLNPAVMGEQGIADRFEREIVVMERLNHPHIVRNYGGGQMDGQLFYAMQLLERGSLKDRLRHGPLPWAQAAAYGVQITSALQHAHNHGIVHRDLKPSNLFFNDNGDLVLGDFGIAHDMQATADITQHGMTVGTFSYMSPEQITADSHIAGPADLYSLGCVLFEMIAGHPPYQGANFAQVWDQHLHKEPPSLRTAPTKTGPTKTDTEVDCPEWLDNLIQQLMAKKPRDRPFSARAVEGVLLQNLLEEFGEEEAKKLTSLEVIDPSSEFDERQPKTWVLWVALAIAAAAIACFSRQGQ